MRFRAIPKDFERIFKPFNNQFFRYTHGFKEREDKVRKEAKPLSFKGIHGFDTETRNGYCILLGTSNDKEGGLKDGAYQDFILSSNTLELLRFLYSHGRNHLNFFYNLEFDFDAIFKQYVIQQSRLRQRHIANEFKFGVYDNHKKLVFKVMHIKGKFLKISEMKEGGIRHSAYFFDAANFYKDGDLNSNGLRHLGIEKMDKELDDYGIAKSDLDFRKMTDEQRSMVIKYCLYDCLITAKLGSKLVKILRDNLGWLPRRLNGEAAITREYLKKNVDERFLKPFIIPINDDGEFLDRWRLELFTGVQEFALRSFTGGYFILFKKGLLSNAEVIDVVSAYGFALTILPDMVNGSWSKVAIMNPNASFGFYHVLIRFDGWRRWYNRKNVLLYPKTYDSRIKKAFFPDGRFEDYITKIELEDLIRRGYKEGIDFEIYEGYEFVHSTIPEYPFKDNVLKLLAKRKEAKGLYGKESMESWLWKTIVNSAYGTIAQNKYGCGELTNFAYASYVTAICRILIRQYAENYMGQITEVATDGVIGIRNNARLNSFPVSVGNLFSGVIPDGQIGSVESDNKKLEGCKNGEKIIAIPITSGLTMSLDGNLVRFRGIPYKERENTSKKRRIVWKDESFEIIKERPLHLRESIARNKPQQINVFSTDWGSKEIRLNDWKRNWFDKKITLEKIKTKLIDSEPLDQFDMMDAGEELIGELEMNDVPKAEFFEELESNGEACYLVKISKGGSLLVHGRSRT